MKSGSASAPSGGYGGAGLAITERPQKPAPSCVAALFQMFAKKKLFSSSSKKSKLLPPVRPHKFSPGRPPVGGDKTAAVAKTRPLLLDSADYSRSKIECNAPQPGEDRNCRDNEMCAPGVVARLMGLSSMPAVSHHQRPTKATDSSEPGDHWNSGRQDWSGTSPSIYTSPQKQQKTGQLIEDRRRDNAGQFNARETRPSWPRRHAHKLASPVRSPRSLSSRNKARLIEAAAKVLEPGLQSRNRRLSWRHAYLEYPCSSDDGAPRAAAVVHNVSDQFLRDLCHVDIPRLGARDIAATSLENYTSVQRTEEDSCKKSIRSRSDQNVPCQLQPDYFLFSSTEKAGFGDSVQKIPNRIADTNRDVPKKQLKSNTLRGSAPHGPLRQNNLKQNALPAACTVAYPGYVIQSKKHRSGERNMRNRTQDFISSNKRLNDSTSLRSKRKVPDRFGESHTGAENKNMSRKGCRASNLHGGTSNKLKLKTGTPKAMEKDMIIAKGAGLVSEKPKSASPNFARSDFQRQPVSHNVSRGNKKSGIISLTSSSPMKVASTLRGDNASGTDTAVNRSPIDTCSKRRSLRDCQDTSPLGEIVFWEDLQGTSNLESTESVFYNQDELENRVVFGGRVASSLFEKKSDGHVTEESLSNGLFKQHKSVDCAIYGNQDPYKVTHLRETRKKHAADAKGSKSSPSISRGSNKRSSPTSILQSRNADDACFSGIPHNLAAEKTFTNSHPREACTAAASIEQDMTTGSNPSPRRGDPSSGQHGVQPSEPDEVQDSKILHPREVTVTTTVELLLTNVRASARHNKKPEESSSPKAFLLRTTECALATLMTTGTTNSNSNSKQDFIINTAIKDKDKDKEASALRSLALDLVWDCLDSTCSRLCSSGYGSFSELLALICTEERLADRVGKEIARCGGMAGRGLDELAVDEVERAVEAGMNPVLEAVQIGAQIEQDLVQELVDEIGVDVFKRW